MEVSMNTKVINSLLALVLCSACSIYGMNRADILGTFATNVVKAKYAKLAQEKAAQPSLLGNWRSYISHVNFTNLKQSTQAGLADALTKSKQALATSRNWAAITVKQHPSILTIPAAVAFGTLAFWTGKTWDDPTVPTAK